MEKTHISRLPHNIHFLERLFFEFEEPFDKALAITDFKAIGGIAKIETNKLLFYYYEIFKRIRNVLQTTLGTFLESGNKFIPPHQQVISDLSFFIHILYLIQERKEFRNLYKLDLSDFDPLEGNYDRLLMKWSSSNGDFTDHDARIRNILRLRGIENFPLPFRLERFLKAVDNNIKEQKRLFAEHKVKYSPDFENNIITLPQDYHWSIENKNIYIFGKYGVYEFQKGENNRKRIFKFIENHRGNIVYTRKIADNLNITLQNVGTTINHLNKIIQKHGLLIKKSGDGRLKMIIV